MTHRQSVQGIWRLLRQRFAEARLGQVAGSLTFTTLLALVPMLAVVLALFSLFPQFAAFQDALQKFFLQSLVPDAIARPVLKTVTQFAGKASKLGAAGGVGVVLSALALMLTIDRALNRIWRVRQPRPLAQRLLIYLAAVTLGPLAVGMSFTAASYAFTAARGWAPMMPVMPLLLRTTLEMLELGCLLMGVVTLYRYLPNTVVHWREALWGGAFVTVAFAVARQALGWYVDAVSGFAAVYGAFATLPILLLWIYIVWVLVLTGALLAAMAPGLIGGLQRRYADLDMRQPGAQFTLALRVLRLLAQRRDAAQPEMALAALSAAVQADPLEVRPLADRLSGWGWLACEDGLYHLRLHPSHCPMDLPVQEWLATPQPGNEAWLQRAGGRGLTLADLL